MTFARRIFAYCLGGIGICYLSCVSTGLYIRPCMVLFGWPMFLLHPRSSPSLPEWFSHYSWSINCLVSAAAWTLLAAIAALVHHALTTRHRHNGSNQQRRPNQHQESIMTYPLPKKSTGRSRKCTTERELASGSRPEGGSTEVEILGAPSERKS